MKGNQMKQKTAGKRIRLLAGLALLTASVSVPAGQVLAASGEIPVGPGWPQTETVSETDTGKKTADGGQTAGGTDDISGQLPFSDGIPEWLTEDVNDVIVVDVRNPESSQASVTYYEKKENWETVFSVPGLVGKAGIADPSEKKEGDKKTPAGIYGFSMAFGILEDPGSRMGYHLVKTGDVWVDDAGSVYYNRLANGREVEEDWSSAENLAAMAPWYDYALALDYNEEQIPGKGSAIFLHCMKEGDTYTSGCISIPEESMALVLRNVDENARIVIR